MTYSSILRVNQFILHPHVSHKVTQHTHIQDKNFLLKFFSHSSVANLLLCLVLVVASLNVNSDAPSDPETKCPCGKRLSPVTYDHNGLQCGK